MRALALLVAAPLAAVGVARADGYVPPDAAKVPGYSATVMPCREDPGQGVACDGGLLARESLRALSLRRNTIYARYGWDGFRKAWLRDHFRAEPWFRPNPRFSYRLLTDADRRNAHFIALREQSYRATELRAMRDKILAGHHGDERQVTPDERVELGLIGRALGDFVEDDAPPAVDGEQDLDHLLPVARLRHLSLRDLRLLRNTVYARRGRTFKSRVLQEHFDGMDWYRADPQYSDARLTRTDERNIALIKSVENEMGGPIGDEGSLIEPATDGA